MACMERSHFCVERKGMEQKLLVLDDPPEHRQTQQRISSVRIRDFGETNVNPEPIERDEETDLLMEEFLSPNKLRLLTGMSNLEEVSYLEMKVDTSENSLGNFGSMVPNLLQLKLNNSTISTVRDLGTSLHNLKTLWMTRCGLTDLDGIGSLTSVTELYLAFNDIVDVSPLSMLDNLRVLDLEGNLVDDISQVEFLCLCTSLRSLTLEGNPVCLAPHPCEPDEVPEDFDYYSAIHKAIPILKYLDDELLLIEKVDGQDVLCQRPQQYKTNKVPDHLITDSQLICESIKESVQPSADEPSCAASTERPCTARGQRPSSARGDRPGSSRRNRPGSSRVPFQRPSSACHQRPGSGDSESCPGSASSGDISGVVDDSSDLTHGSGRVICGNISRALNRRKKDMSVKTIDGTDCVTKEPHMRFLPEKSFEDSSIDMKTREDVFEELRKWRDEYSKILGNETNILRIQENSPVDFDSRVFEESNKELTVPSEPQQEILSPSPPSSSRQSVLGLPSESRRPLPTPPIFGWGRRQTTADFKIRRHRQRSTEKPVGHSYHAADESFDVEKSPATVQHPTLNNNSEVTEPRSFSAPVKATQMFRLLPEKTSLEANASQKRGSRPSSQPPSRSVRLLPRPITAASVQKQRPQLPK